MIKVWTIAFNDTNPEGTYVAGDVVDIYYDSATDTSPGSNIYAGLVVKLNDVIVTSGSNIKTANQTYKTVRGYGVQICNSGYFVAFSPLSQSFPYGFNVYFYAGGAGQLCEINAAVCDLAFTPSIILTPSSSPTSNDGQIEVLATSSNDIKYKLGSDFDYTDGTGTSSPIFTNLYPGAYRIFARDSINCHASVLVDLNYSDAYGVKYTISYKNLAGHSTKIDILQRAYSSGSTDLICGDTPITINLRAEGVLDKFQPVIASEAIVNLISESNAQFQELYTNDPKKYKINFYKDTSGGTSYSLQWTGFVVPQIYSESYIIHPYNVSVRASDGLPNLGKYLFLNNDGSRFIGSIRVMTLISIILKKTNLSLNIRSGCNLFADDMDQTSADDPLDQAYVDVDTYYLGFNNTPTFIDVLICILKSFRARIVQSGGVWNILRPEEMITSFAYREFDSDGNYLSNSTYDPISEVKSTALTNRLRWSEQNQNLEIRPGYGKLRLRYHLGFKDNILRNGDFSLINTWNALAGAYTSEINLYGWQVISLSYPIQSTYQLNNPGDVNDVSLYLSADTDDVTTPLGYIQSANYMMAMGVNNQIKLSIRVKIPSPYSFGVAVDGSGNTVFYPIKTKYYYQKVRVRVYYGGKYLMTDGNWTNIPTDVFFYYDKFDEFVTFDLTASWPDPTYSTEKQFYLKVFHSWSEDCEYTSVSDLKNKITNSGVAASNNRGNFDASGGNFPSTGGSGGGGAIVYGDRWTVNVAGTIQGVYVATTVHLRCIKTTPGQDADNWLIGEITLPSGTKTEIKKLTSAGSVTTVYYYELQNNTDTPDDVNIIRPNDYNSSTNPYQWVLKTYNAIISSRPAVEMFIDKIQVQYLQNGGNPFDAIINEIQGEPNNLSAYEDDVFHGSLKSLLSSISDTLLISNTKTKSGFPLDFSLDGQFPSNKTIFPNILTIPITSTVLSGKLIYAGYYRDVDGNGYGNWARNGIGESTDLGKIWLKTTIAQYNRSWRKITGSLYSNDVFVPLANVIKDLDDVIYLPISLSIDDKNNSYNGEFLELIDISEGAGSDGTLVSPYSSGLSSGFSGG